jgi:NADPH:quinone reductase-like Zn-dependent oxidoreductase
MRAFAVKSFGEAPAIHDLPIPAADGAFLIRVRCAGVDPIDYKLLEQLTATSTYPFVMGIDFAGVVERVPTGERDLHIGDHVFGMARTHGAYAEYTAVAPGVETEPLARIPDSVTDEQAAALPIAAITALRWLELLGSNHGDNIASSTNPLSTPQGLNEVARMLADGTITARIRSAVELDQAGQMLEKLRSGGLRGKAVIRL